MNFIWKKQKIGVKRSASCGCPGANLTGCQASWWLGCDGSFTWIKLCVTWIKIVRMPKEVCYKLSYTSEISDFAIDVQHVPFSTIFFSPSWCWIYMETRQIWGIWKLRPAYSLETPNLGQNRWCFVPYDIEIWWMTLENNRASFLCCFKLCETFHSHRGIQTGVTVRKRPIWVKFDDF